MAWERQHGYLWPTPVDPGELQCIRVYIPKADRYLDAFWQAYEYFTFWLAWVRDPLHTGKVAAGVWRVAFDKARAEYLATGGCEMNVTGVRLDPLNSCTLQVEFDGNNVWVAVADLSKCGGPGGGTVPPLRFDGTNIQIYNDCDDEWENQGEPTTPGIAPVMPVAPVGFTIDECISAANLATMLEAAKNTMCTRLGTVATIGEAAVGMIDVLLTQMGIGILFSTVIGILIAQYGEWSAHFTDAAAENLTVPIQDIAVRYYAADGTMTEVNRKALVADMNAIWNTYSPGTGEHVAWGMVISMVVNASAAHMAQLGVGAGITSADCSAAEWQKTFDFTLDDQGWTYLGGGHYVPGSGWRETYIHPSGFSVEGIRIQRNIPLTTVTRVRCEYHVVLGANDFNAEARNGVIRYNVDDPGFQLQQETGGGGDVVLEWIGSQTGLASIIFIKNAGFNDVGHADPGGTVLLTRIIVNGTGTNPFV